MICHIPFCTQGAVLHVNIEDKDTNKANDLVDAFSITINSNTPVGKETAPAMYNGIFGLTHIELSFSILCVEDFYGPFCNITCRSRDCRTCLPGYSGDFCQTNIDDCIGVNCSGNGVCLDQTGSFTCACFPGFTGPICETINNCNHAQCINGHCINQATTFICSCDIGFTGILCDVIDYCANNNCTDHSYCVSSEDGYTCPCVVGYTGQLCEFNIDDCFGIICPENHKCVDGLNSHECVCVDEVTGTVNFTTDTECEQIEIN